MISYSKIIFLIVFSFVRTVKAFFHIYMNKVVFARIILLVDVKNIFK
jgi:hypothetical protein